MKLMTALLVIAFGSIGLAQSKTTTTTTNRSNSAAQQNEVSSNASAATADTTASPEYSSANQNYSSTTVVEEKDDSISAGGLFIEPSLGFTKDETTSRTGALPFLSDTSGNLQGGSLGLRLGLHASEVIFLAADGRYTRAELDDSSYEKASGDMWNAGATLGFQMPVAGLRIWGTYIGAGQFDPGAGAGGTDVLVKEGTGWRAGGGLRYKAVSVNLEYQEITYDKTEIQALGGIATSTDTNIDFENKGYTLSLSFPMEL